MRLNLEYLKTQWLTTITAKLIIGIMILVGLMSIFIYMFFPDQLEHQVLEMVSQKAETFSTAISFASARALLTDDLEMGKRIMAVARQIEGLDYVVIQDSAGMVFCSTSLHVAEEINYRETNGGFSGSHYFIRRAILADNRHIGNIFIGFSTTDALATIMQSHKNAAGIGIFFIVLGIILIVILRKTLLKPVDAITQTVREVAGGAASQRIEVKSNDDFGVLAGMLNIMFDGWETSQREWGVLNKGLEERVAERTLKLEEEINERKKAEEDLRLFMARLEKSNRELEDFAFVASHDLQEPLRKVQAFGDRLKAACGNELSEKAITYLDRMQSAANRMQILIKDLLTFSRVTSKAQPFVSVNIKSTVEEVLSDLEVTIERMRGTVKVGDLPEIEADPLQMRQLFQNLIGNALKFHKRDEPPIVKVYSEYIQGLNTSDGPGKKLCHIAIEDNGIGFDEKYTERIFTVFQRLHGRSEYEGTGLGLAVCRKIVERHGGVITAQSSPGNGAIFLITLPIIQNETKHSTDKLKVAAKQKSQRSDEDLLKKTNRGLETSFMVPYP
jgi:signal transduction histidine kinase